MSWRARSYLSTFHHNRQAKTLPSRRSSHWGNLFQAGLDGTLRASADGTVAVGLPWTTYDVSGLQPRETISASLLVIGPKAGVNHTLKVEFVNNAGVVLATTEQEFDTAADYSLTLIGHVFETRSLRNHSVIFGYDYWGLQAPQEKAFGLSAWYGLGDLGDGDDFKLGFQVKFSLVPYNLPTRVLIYSLFNYSNPPGEDTRYGIQPRRFR